MNKSILLLCVVLVTTTFLLGVTESRYINFHHLRERRSNSNARDSCKRTAMENNESCYDTAMKKGDTDQASESCHTVYENEKKACDTLYPMDHM